MEKALAFSGGKDSWACLWLLLESGELDSTLVIWVNTGKNVPEVLRTIETAQLLCANFLEVMTNQAEQNAAFGLPSEVVPVDWTALGQAMTSKKPMMVQSYLDCCFANISMPLHQAALANGVKVLVRGQRNADGHKGIARNGDVVDGIMLHHPIETWTDREVLEFCEARMELPSHFSLKHSSVDCYDCTAYRAESKDKLAFLRDKHPSLYAGYEKRATDLKAACQGALE